MVRVKSTTGRMLGSTLFLEGDGLSMRQHSSIERQREGWYVRLFPLHPCYRAQERCGMFFHDVVPFIQRAMRDEFFTDFYFVAHSLIELTDWMLEQERLFEAAKAQSVHF